MGLLLFLGALRLMFLLLLLLLLFFVAGDMFAVVFCALFTAVIRPSR